MKFITTLIIALLFSLFTNAQEIVSEKSEDEVKTVFGNIFSYGGYGGLSYHYGIIEERNTFLNGGRAAWLVNHSLGIGFAGYAFKTKSKNDDHLGNIRFRYSGGYGGVLIEPIIASKSMIHLTFPVIIGGGGIGYKERNTNSDDYIEDRTAYYMVEPGLEIEINIVKFFRISIGAYYRFTSDVKLKYKDGYPISDNDILNDFSCGVNLKFGRF